MKRNYENLCVITENLANLYNDGIPIYMSFELLLDLPLKKEYKKSLREINYRILKGDSISDGFKRYKELYPDFFINIVSLGEDSGSLAKCLNSLNEFYDTKNKFEKNMINKLRYPLFTLATLFVVVCLLILFVIPSFYEAFSSITSNVPKSIVFINKISKWILSNIFVSCIALVCWNIALYFVWKLIKEKLDYNLILIRFKFVRNYYEYIFILLLATIMNSGIHVSEGIYILIKSMEDSYLKRYFIKVKDKVLDGDELSKSIKEICFISKYTYSMINLGEKTGELEGILRKIEKRLNKNMSNNIKKIERSIAPISVVVLSILILVFFIIFVMPLLDMMYLGMNI